MMNASTLKVINNGKMDNIGITSVSFLVSCTGALRMAVHVLIWLNIDSSKETIS